MMDGQRIGRIEAASFGLGGYQDAQMGFSLTFSSTKDCWGVSYFKGYWATRSEYAEWSLEDQAKSFADAVALVRDTLQAAKVSSVDKLVGIPVAVTFDRNILASWRVLEEVL